MYTMGEDVHVDFKSQFYNLQGIHINERKKNLNKLLKSTKIDIPDDQIDIQPRNYQENIFYIDVLIHFKKVGKLIEILQRGTDGVLSSNILKQQWFFQEAFQNMSEEDIVNNFLPTLSHSLRMKILKKLSQTLNEDRMDTIFDLLLERYGIYIAKQFLFGCSIGKITHVLRNHDITLLPELLKRLAQKDLELLKIYIQEYKKNKKSDFNDYQFLNYLIWKHPNLYFDLGLDAQCGIKVGRHTTRAIIKTNQEDVVKDIKNNRLNMSALVREVKEFDKEYLSLFFPNEVKNIIHEAYSLVSLLSKYPIKKRWEVFSHAFRKFYNTEVVEHLDLFEENLGKFFPENIQRKWAEIKYLNGCNLRYIKYYDPKNAFKLLKDKINVTSDIQTRGLFLNELITVCYKHKDYSTYEEVLKYICSRHRNDHTNVRSNLINHIDKHIDYDLITEAHWKYINALIDIQRIKNENLSCAVMSRYLVFAYKNKLPLDEPLTQYSKDCIKSGDSLRCSLPSGANEVEAESALLKYMVKILPSIEHGTRKITTFTLMNNIVVFNKEVKNDKILNKKFKIVWVDLNECPVILDLINKVLTKQPSYDNYDCRIVSTLLMYHLYSEVPIKGIDEDALLNIIKTMLKDECNAYMVIEVIEIIKKSKRNCFEEKLLDYFFTEIIKTPTLYSQDGLKHFLKREPAVIAKYFRVILRLDSESDYVLPFLDYNIIKKYSHLGLGESVITQFKELVSVDSKNERKIKLFNALSKVMNTTEFLDVVKDYIPDVNKLDVDNEDQKKIYQNQCDIAKAFKNLDKASYHTLAPVLIKHFCQGDYLQSSLPALYKVMYGINEETALSYINELGARKAISARKHAVFLSFEILPITDAMSVYTVASNKETNISAKKYLFNSILKYFIRNSLRSLVDIVALNMHFIDGNDSEMIKTLVESVSKVPNEYKPFFIEKVWRFLDSLERQEVNFISERNKILCTINENEMILVSKTNKIFYEDIIKRHFLSRDNELLKSSSELYSFVVRFLLANLDESHFEFIFNIIRLYKETHWESENNDNLMYIFRLFTHAYKTCDDENNLQFIKLFTKFWQQTFSRLESFYHDILLKLMILYKENTNIEVFCKEVDKFFEEIMAEYGPYIGDLLFKSIGTFYFTIYNKNSYFELGNFAFYLLQSNSSELNCFVASNIIKEYNTVNREKVVDALKSASYLTAKVYSNILRKGINI